MNLVQVRLCPAAAPTMDAMREFMRVPQRGESLVTEFGRYVVVDIDWHEDGTPHVIAHEYGRPRAEAALSAR